MTSRKGVMNLLGVGDSDDNPVANIYRSMCGATQAWKCDTCGEWICNSCVCQTVTAGQAGQIRHSNCGGMFRAPQ
jgi:hypothetical protein